MLVPSLLQQFFGADHPLGGQQDLQHSELLAAQTDLAAVAADVPGAQVELAFSTDARAYDERRSRARTRATNSGSRNGLAR